MKKFTEIYPFIKKVNFFTDKKTFAPIMEIIFNNGKNKNFN